MASKDAANDNVVISNSTLGDDILLEDDGLNAKLKDIQNLLETYNQLQKQLSDIEAYRHISNPNEPSSSSPTREEELDSMDNRICLLQERLLNLRTKAYQGRCIKEGLRLEKAQIGLLTEGGGSAFANAYKARLEKLDMLTVLVAEETSKIQAMKRAQRELSGRRLEAETKCRLLARNYHLNRLVPAGSVAGGSMVADLDRRAEELKATEEKILLLRGLAQHLVLASGLNIGEDIRLQELMTDLDKPLDSIANGD